MNPFSPEGVRGILRTIEACDGCSIAEICEAMFWGHPSDRQYVGNVLRTLAALGLVRRAQAPARHANNAPRVLWHLVPGFEAPRAPMAELDRSQVQLAVHVLRTFIRVGDLGQPSIDLVAHLEREQQRLGWR